MNNVKQGIATSIAPNKKDQITSADLAEFCKEYISEHGASDLAKLLGQALLQTGYKLDTPVLSLNYDFGEVTVTCTPICPSQIH